ncbi:type III-B CRISPR module RAMP protein Cmr1 [Sulfurisphaera ohwakuensis]|uniref:type III-B CRISPR module RAMP protein Cmr1 n=1 Tax=Sulfurisphaera ohwakuensis TaxID=69656 RepID=UPI0036F2D7DE
MEELLMSLRLKVLYPLTGGYNRHSKNQFYEEFVRPTEIKGLWRWWNRVLFNSLSGKLYTYDSIDRLFEDVFGSEDKKSAVRLEVISEEGGNFELPEVELDKVADCLKDYKGKITLDFKDNLIVKAGNTQIPIYSKSNINIDENKDLVFKNDLLNFELLGFSSIEIDATKISGKDVLEEILRDLITDYLEYFNIKREMEFTLNIYLDKNRKQENFDAKLKFALYSLLLFIILGGIGRKTSRGFGSLSLLDVKCYDQELCGFYDNKVREIKEYIKNRKSNELVNSLVFNNEIKKLFKGINDGVSLGSGDFVYYLKPNLLDIKEITGNSIKCVLNAIANKVAPANGECNKRIINEEYKRKAFVLAFNGNREIRKNKNKKDKILDIASDTTVNIYLKENYVKNEYIDIIKRDVRRPSILRFKIIEVEGAYYLISYILYSNYLKDEIIDDISQKLQKISECVVKNGDS